MPSSSPHDPAVSPVIGTILLVALTVVFVAVVVSVVFGVSGGLFNGKVVGVTLEPYVVVDQERGVSVLIHGGKDAGDIQSLRTAVEGVTVYYQSLSTPAVGNPVTGVPYHFQVSNSDYEELINRLVTVTATFSDGTEVVLLQKVISLPQIEVQYAAMPTAYLGITTPGHGVNITFNDAAVAGNVSKFWVEMEVLVNGKIETIRLNYDARTTSTSCSNPQVGKTYTFYIYPKDPDHPYSTAWQDGQLTGTVKIYATAKTGKSLTGVDGSSGTTGNVLLSQSTRTVEARKAIYEDFDVGYTLKALSKDASDVYTLQSSGNNGETYGQICYVIHNGTNLVQYSYPSQLLNNTQIRFGNEAKLDNYGDDVKLEVFVRTPVTTAVGTTTTAWHKIYNTSIGDICATLTKI